MDLYARDVRRSLERYYPRSDVALLQPDGPVLRSKFRRRIRILLDRYLFLPRSVRESRSSVVHILDQTYAHLTRAARPARVVITCHDCIPLLKPRLSIGWLLFRLVAVPQLRRADRVIAISQTTRNELVRRLGVGPERVRVAPYGLDRCFFEARWHGPRPTLRILHVGTNADYKRVPLVVKTAVRLASRRQHVELWKVGEPLGADIQKALDGVGGLLRNFGWVPHDELPAILADASALLFPSAVEGFGRPLAEALAIGLPVVASDVESLRETTGGNAVHVGGADPEAFARAIESLVDRPEHAYFLSDRGRTWARKYRWDTHAATLRDVYAELASQER
jgi:glycosyltransferase involved in cell wall biosynthesis